MLNKKGLGENFFKNMPDILEQALKKNSKTKSIIFTRHGESRGNINNIFSGSINVDLTERGKGQATKMNTFLEPYIHQFDRIVSSPKLRAIKTCEFALQTSLVDQYQGLNEFGSEIELDQAILHFSKEKFNEQLKKKFSIDSRIKEVSFGKLERTKIEDIGRNVFFLFYEGKVGITFLYSFLYLLT